MKEVDISRLVNLKESLVEKVEKNLLEEFLKEVEKNSHTIKEEIVFFIEVIEQAMLKFFRTKNYKAIFDLLPLVYDFPTKFIMNLLDGLNLKYLSSVDAYKLKRVRFGYSKLESELKKVTAKDLIPLPPKEDIFL